MTDQPLVSIVIPCFNYGRYLAEAIQSALAQTYRPIEVIVVDDGSTDNTQEVARRYRVGVLTQPRSGVCVAVNRGMQAVEGELVMRLDADDFLEPSYVEEMVQALDRTPAAVLAYSDGEYAGAARGRFVVPEFDGESLAQGAYAVCLALMRRQALAEVGGYDPDMGRLRCEDWDLWLTFAERGWAGVHVPRVLWHYRRHAQRSRNSWDLLSPRGIHRELQLIATLQDRHPALFATERLLARLRRLPESLVKRRVSARHGALLTTFYSVMLARIVLRRNGSKASWRTAPS
jgi:glycosyltransferase involved in cell wall biosynthesis